MKTLLSLGVLAAMALLLVSPGAAQDIIPNDITVTFTVCLEGTGTSGDVCITGNNAAITDWGSGVLLSNTEGDLWTADVVFTAGTLAAVEYKYRRDGCVNWENDPNRTLTLPIDGTTTVVVDPESFNRVTPLGCGFSAPLGQDVSICFQVCLEGVSYMGDNCVIGNIPELGEFGTGLTLNQVGPDLFQRCMIFPAGTMVPLDIQYKFQKDDCSAWEQIGEDPFVNREFQLTVDSPVAQTLTSAWGDGAGICTPVAVEATTWSTLKANFDD